MPKPSPLVSSAPSRECRLWTISEFCRPYRSSSSRTGEPEYASQRHISRGSCPREKHRASSRWDAAALAASRDLCKRQRPRQGRGAVLAVLATDYPFLDIFWTMCIFFAWVIWIWLLIL